MKALLFLPAALALMALTSGCTLTEKYNRNNAAASSWIEQNSKKPARADFEGVYYSPDWGAVVLKQKGSSLSGSIAHFHLKGVVSGKSAYLLLVDDEWVEHTMILHRKSAEVVEGSYSSHVPYVEKDRLPVHLDKIVE